MAAGFMLGMQPGGRTVKSLLYATSVLDQRGGQGALAHSRGDGFRLGAAHVDVRQVGGVRRRSGGLAGGWVHGWTDVWSLQFGA